MFHITLFYWGERQGEGGGGGGAHLGLQNSFNSEFMEAAVVKNEDLLRGLRSSGSSTAER